MAAQYNGKSSQIPDDQIQASPVVQSKSTTISTEDVFPEIPPIRIPPVSIPDVSIDTLMGPFFMTSEERFPQPTPGQSIVTKPSSVSDIFNYLTDHTSSESSQTQSGMSTGAKVGISIGVVIGTLLVIMEMYQNARRIRRWIRRSDAKGDVEKFEKPELDGKEAKCVKIVELRSGPRSPVELPVEEPHHELS